MARTGNVGSLQDIKTMSFPSATPKHNFSSLNGGSVLGHYNNLNKILIPALALFALANLQTVAAGPVSYTACLAACVATGPAFPACAAACTPALLPICP